MSFYHRLRINISNRNLGYYAILIRAYIQSPSFPTQDFVFINSLGFSQWHYRCSAISNTQFTEQIKSTKARIWNSKHIWSRMKSLIVQLMMIKENFSTSQETNFLQSRLDFPLEWGLAHLFPQICRARLQSWLSWGPPAPPHSKTSHWAHWGHLRSTGDTTKFLLLKTGKDVAFVPLVVRSINTEITIDWSHI